MTDRPRALNGASGGTRLTSVAGSPMLRTALFPAGVRPRWWPDVDDPDSCRSWLDEMWHVEGFATALETASPGLARAVQVYLAERRSSPKQVRKTVLSVIGYALRATDRSTPFSLFAGVALADTEERGGTRVSVGSAHRPFIAADTAWVAAVRTGLETRQDVLEVVGLHANPLLTRHGSIGGLSAPDGRMVWVKMSGPLRLLLALAARPTPYRDMVTALREKGGSEDQVRRLIAHAIEQTLLLTTLRAPMSEPDPLDHLLKCLLPHRDSLGAATAEDLDVLNRVRGLLAEHNVEAPTASRSDLRIAAERDMARLDTSTRSRLAITTRADAQVRLPKVVADETSRAAHALMRLTRNPRVQSTWAQYHTMFWERYGRDVLVPVKDVTDPGIGIGFPADYASSVWRVPETEVLDRDRKFAALAWKGLSSGGNEIVLSERDIDDLAGVSGEEQVPTPNVDLGVQIAARSQQAVDAGDFLLHARPAWSTGVLSGRFAACTDPRALAGIYQGMPTLVEGAIRAQLLFAPVHAHSENVSRIPVMLPSVLSVDPADPNANALVKTAGAAEVIGLDDLALYAGSDGLRLVSMSRRRVVEPMVLHPLDLQKQAPPIARFLAHVARSSATAWTRFDWGPTLNEMPRLPRVRYGRTILSPARWRLRAEDLSTEHSSSLPVVDDWHQAMTAWAKESDCPRLVGLEEEDMVIRLDLSEPAHTSLLRDHLRKHEVAMLVETLSNEDLAWIGHSHEVVYPIASAVPPAPHPDLSRTPIHRRSPASSGSAFDHDVEQTWTQARIFTNPDLMDDLITRQIPRLMASLSDRNEARLTAEATAGDPRWWFIRYRSIEDEDHLRIRVISPGRGPETTEAINIWFDEVHAERLAHRVVFDAYEPEAGRYGQGETLRAAENVFEADSDLVLKILAAQRLDKPTACTLSMLDLACSFLGADQALPLLTRGKWDTSGDRTVTKKTVTNALDPRAALTEGSAAVAVALEQRSEVLGRYRDLLRRAPDSGPASARSEADVLESLLHMHHNRLLGLDRASEGQCRHALAQAARSLMARSAP